MSSEVSRMADLCTGNEVGIELALKAVESAAKRSKNPAGFIRAVLGEIAIFENGSVWNMSERTDAIKAILLSMADVYEVDRVEAKCRQGDKPDVEERPKDGRKLRTFFECMIGNDEDQRRRRYEVLLGYIQGNKGIMVSRVLRKAMKKRWLRKDIGRGELLRLVETEKFNWNENTVENIFKTMKDDLTSRDEYYLSDLDFSDL